MSVRVARSRPRLSQIFCVCVCVCVLADTLLLQRNRRPGLRLKLPSTVNPIEDGFDTNSGSTDKDILFHSGHVRAVVALSGFSSGFSPVPSVQTCLMAKHQRSQKLNSLEPMGTIFRFVQPPGTAFLLRLRDGELGDQGVSCDPKISHLDGSIPKFRLVHR